MTANFNITYHGDKTMAEINEVMMQTPSGRPSTSGILKELNSFTLNSQKMTLQGHAFLINDCHPPYLRCSIKSLMQIRIFDETSNEASGITVFDLTEEAGTNRASDHQWPFGYVHVDEHDFCLSCTWWPVRIRFFKDLRRISAPARNVNRYREKVRTWLDNRCIVFWIHQKEGSR